MQLEAPMSTLWFPATNLSPLSRAGNRFSKPIASPKLNLRLRYPQSRMQEEGGSANSRNPTRYDEGLSFSHLQIAGDGIRKLEFGQYVAREAVADEEYWAAALLRATTRYEDLPPERKTAIYIRKYTDQEFDAIRRRCSVKRMEYCTCIVVAREADKNEKQTSIKSIVGTLDLSISNLSKGERIPQLNLKTVSFPFTNRMSAKRYGYIRNLVVSKSMRREGIASNMLRFAIQTARLKGAENVLLLVHSENTAAQTLYKNMGFQMVDTSGSSVVPDGNYLMRFNL